MRLNVVSGILISVLVMGVFVSAPVSLAAGIDGNEQTALSNSAEQDNSKESTAQDDSLKSAAAIAKAALKDKSFSRTGLLNYLSKEKGISASEADAAIEILEKKELVDWNEEAVFAAEDLLAIKDYSRQDMIDKLSGDEGLGFTREQAVYAADYIEIKAIADWIE